jgi:hypothetical protein
MGFILKVVIKLRDIEPELAGAAGHDTCGMTNKVLISRQGLVMLWQLLLIRDLLLCLRVICCLGDRQWSIVELLSSACLHMQVHSHTSKYTQMGVHATDLGPFTHAYS